jgi:hypothetical protein
MNERPHQFFVIHVVRRTGNPGIVQPALVNQLQQVVHTRQDIVHEDDRVEMFSVRISEFVKRYESGVSHFSQILDTMSEIAPGSHRGTNVNLQSDGPTKSVEYTQEGFRLIV